MASSTPPTQSKISTFYQAKLGLREQIERGLALLRTSHIQKEIQEQVLRVEVLVENVDVLTWLNSQKEHPKIYWRSRDTSFEVAGIGSALTIRKNDFRHIREVMERMQSLLDRKERDIRFYGGFSFNDDVINENRWKPFGQTHFIIPQFELVKTAKGVSLACNFLYNNDYQNRLQEVYESLSQLVTDITVDGVQHNTYLFREDVPTKESWLQTTESAINDIKNGDYDKVVLSRRSTIEMAESVKPIGFLSRLRQYSNNTFNFCFQPESGFAFLGASPERLFRIINNKIDTEAIAGTRIRGKSNAEDDWIGQELLKSEKDILEHKVVMDMIEESLFPFVEAIQKDDSVSLLKLTHLQHLNFRFSGELKGDISFYEILKSFHPTPAIAGYPKHLSLSAIQKYEAFERGWFSAPIGWISHDSAEFVVAIRSALIYENKISLYAGAGINAGSDPGKEWQEVEDKISRYLKLLES
jgi:menaquinone-specific isochorismate synthase